MKTLLIGNYKGGIAKTSTTVVLANLFADDGYRTLVVDFDSQMTGTNSLIVNLQNKQVIKNRNILNAVNVKNLTSNIVQIKTNLDIIPGHPDIMDYENIVKGKNHNSPTLLVLKSMIDVLKAEGMYDIVLFDIAPSNSYLNTSVTLASENHLILTTPEPAAFDSLKTYYNDLTLLHSLGIELNIIGILLSMTSHYNINKRTAREIRLKYTNLVFKTEIKRRTKVTAYLQNGLPPRNRKGKYYSEDLKVLQMYEDLRDEILKKL
jgi:chromosome partitioning protein